MNLKPTIATAMIVAMMAGVSAPIMPALADGTPTSCSDVVLGTDTCDGGFACEGGGEIVVSGSGIGGSVTASCGGASKTCNWGSFGQSCPKTEDVPSSDKDGVCTAVGQGTYSCASTPPL